MTTRQSSAPAPRFADPGKRKVTKGDWIPFWIGDTQFHMLMPKTYDIAQIVAAVESPTGLDDPQNMRVMLQFAGRCVRYVVKEPPAEDGSPRGRDLIEYRLADPDDLFDLNHFVPILMDLTRGFLARPTGSPRVSSAPRRQASGGRGSTARTRSTRAKT